MILVIFKIDFFLITYNIEFKISVKIMLSCIHIVPSTFRKLIDIKFIN